MFRLSKTLLLDRFVHGVEASGWSPIIGSRTHPFELVAINDAERLSLVVYIWNITHGGGAARPADEYRIQLTGVVPPLVSRQDATTLLLGWAEEWSVFAA